MKAAVAAPASQAIGRQRGDSSRPVGNRRGMNTSANAMVRYHVPPSRAQATRMGSGSDPDRVQ
jgi:hypothetical protein